MSKLTPKLLKQCKILQLNLKTKCSHMTHAVCFPDSLSNWCGLMGAMYGDYVIESNLDSDHMNKLQHTALALSTHIMSKGII